jgi:hypothetical protein
MVVQRGGVERHADLACGRPGVSKIDKLQVLKRTGFLTVQAFIIRLSFLEDTVSIGPEWASATACLSANTERGKEKKRRF